MSDKKKKGEPHEHKAPAAYRVHRPDVSAIDSRPVANGVEGPVSVAYAVLGTTAGGDRIYGLRRKPEPMA